MHALTKFDRTFEGTHSDDLVAGRMNQSILETFLKMLMFANQGERVKVWEPFAGHSEPRNTFQDFAGGIGCDLIAYDVAPVDSRVTKVNSVKVGPPCIVHGVLFHPPYFGTALFSDDPNDLSLVQTEVCYRERIGEAMKLGVESTKYGGLVCAVGRRYRYQNREIRLDNWFLDAMTENGLMHLETWSAMPDIVLLGGVA